MDFPKPVSLIKELIVQANLASGEIIIDFFAGSATTADAVVQLNASDGLLRRFIMIQLPQETDNSTEAFKAGYKTIAEVSKERIRRAGKKISAELTNGSVDTGFRVLKIDTSNMADVYYAPDALDKANLGLFVDNIKPDRTAEDLLFQVMLDWGVDLALPIGLEIVKSENGKVKFEPVASDNFTLHPSAFTILTAGEDALVACFDNTGRIDEVFVKELAKRKPLRVVFRDAGFKDDATKINVEQIFKLLSPSTEVKCI